LEEIDHQLSGSGPVPLEKALRAELE
jgi:hypothetical protein